MTQGRMLRKLCQKKGMTQWELSKLIGITPGRLLLIERGHRPLPPECVESTAKALDVSEDMIAGRTLRS